jgi:hypothetical protein
MAAQLAALCIDTLDPAGLARFWAGVLGREAVTGSDSVELLPDDDVSFPIRFVATNLPRSGPNWLHVDLTSDSPEAQQETVARALRLGG